MLNINGISNPSSKSKFSSSKEFQEFTMAEYLIVNGTGNLYCSEAVNPEEEVIIEEEDEEEDDDDYDPDYEDEEDEEDPDFEEVV